MRLASIFRSAWFLSVQRLVEVESLLIETEAFGLQIDRGSNLAEATECCCQLGANRRIVLAFFRELRVKLARLF